MKRICNLFLFVFLAPALSWSQSGSNHFKIAYQGGLITHPGLSLGWSKTFLNREKTKRKGAAQREWRYGFSLSAYRHRRMQTGLLITPQLEKIHTSARGNQWGAGVAAGYLRAFIPNTYSVSDDGHVSKEKLSGTNHAVFMPYFRFGKDLEVRLNLPLSWYVQTNLMFQFPYFEQTNKYLLLEAGVQYQF